VESAVFGDSTGWAAVAAGLPALVGRDVEAALAQPPVATVDQAAGVVGAGGHPPVGAVTIFMLLGVRHVRFSPRWWLRERGQGRGL
jgi:hypothetical protein